MTRIHRLILLAATAALTAGGSLAVADKTTIDDPKDAPGRVDIKSVSAGHDGGKLVHKITYYATVKKGEESGVNIYAGRFNRVGGPSYQVTSYGVTDGTGMKTGKVKMTRPNKRTVVYKFGKGAIGNPASYKWQACVCPEGDRQDVAPKKPAKHELD